MKPLLTIAALAALVHAAPATGDSACNASSECVARQGNGSVCVTGTCQPYVDKTDLLVALGLSGNATPVPEPFKLYPAIIPAIGYNPALGFLVGVVANAGIYLGDPDRTTISNASALVMLTSEKQLVIQLNGVAMTARNEWELQSDWRFLVYNQDTYGLGTGVTPISRGITINGWGATAAIPGAQPMDFDYIRFHQLALRKIVGEVYAGGGFRYDRYFAIGDRSLDLSATPEPVVTSHYAYSKYYGFGTGAYSVSGVSLSVLYDSRDSTISPYRGLYANVDYRINPEWLGSSKASSLLFGEFRCYLPLSDDVPRDVLAFWVLAQGVVTGEMPYLALPSTAWDARSVTGRGFIQGRFRGPAEVYGEAELRFRITNNGLLGGALFVNAQTFSRPAVSVPAYNYHGSGESLFDNVVPAGGVGLRFMMNREARTAVRLDVAAGQDQVAFYLGAGEVF